jgi:hypothetical protein
MKKPGNKVISIYLIWELLHLILLFDPSGVPSQNGYTFETYFYPFTKGNINSNHYFNVNEYDISEFAFYSIAPILIYYAITFWNKKPNA